MDALVFELDSAILTRFHQSKTHSRSKGVKTEGSILAIQRVQGKMTRSTNMDDKEGEGMQDKQCRQIDNPRVHVVL